METIMKRDIEKHLLAWKGNPDRRVLLLRGARQVGKTYSVRELARTFPYFCEVNFEEQPQVCAFFKQTHDPKELVKKLTMFYGIPIEPGQTILFFDEIQACPNAIQSLRFFYEKMPGLHVVAAGSLLEFAIQELPSYGVGRIESLYMYPLSFGEFLDAFGMTAAREAIAAASPDTPLDPVIHRRLLELVAYYYAVGGMPAAAKVFIESGDFIKARAVLDLLIASFHDDFAKYRRRAPQRRLRDVFRSVAQQSGGKFKYSAVSDEKSALLRESLDLLVKSGLVYQVFNTTARGVPLGVQSDHRHFKAIIFDTAIAQRLLGLNSIDYIADSPQDLVNRGSIAEQFVGLELVKAARPHTPPELYYWHREARASNAEVDYIVERAGGIITPVEVKSGSSGQMQSMRLFISERKIPLGIRVSGEQFGRYEDIFSLPLYAAGRAYDVTT